MAVRQVVKGEHGYRLVFREGLVWLVRGGTVVYVSTWRPCCPVHVSIAAGTLASITTADWVARETS